jgi:ribosomal protein L28
VYSAEEGGGRGGEVCGVGSGLASSLGEYAAEFARRSNLASLQDLAGLIAGDGTFLDVAMSCWALKFVERQGLRDVFVLLLD